MSDSAPTPTLAEAEERLAEIERVLAEQIPALQAEALYIRGFIAGITTNSPDPAEEPEA